MYQHTLSHNYMEHFVSTLRLSFQEILNVAQNKADRNIEMSLIQSIQYQNLVQFYSTSDSVSTVRATLGPKSEFSM